MGRAHPLNAVVPRAHPLEPQEASECSCSSSDPVLSRRSLLAITAIASSSLGASWSHAKADEATLPDPSALSEYVNTKQGYSVSVPSGWEKIDKAGADVLFEDPGRRSTSLGVTVNPVRVPDIGGFGTLEAVGEKLLDAERKKDGTLSANMLTQASRQSKCGALLYEYEYDLDSTRGHKRILNTVTIYKSKLYIMNAMYKCEKTDASCDSQEALGTIATLRALSASFELLG